MFITEIKEVSATKIRMQRAKLHISQQKLGNIIGISREKINAIENNRCKKINRDILLKLANAFNVEEKDLLKKEEIMWGLVN